MTNEGAATTEQREDGPRSLRRTLRILEHVAGLPGGASLSGLSEQLSAPKSSLLGLLRPLCALGYVVQTEGRYRLGPAAYRLGVAMMPMSSMSRLAVPIMRQLVEQCDETVLIATLDREAGLATYVEKIESTRSIRYTVPLGTSRPLYCSAAGRVLLAYADQEFADRYFRTARFVPLTPRTLTQPAELRALLPGIRSEGLAMTEGEVSSDVAGFAAPILDSAGVVVAALAMAAPVSRVRTPAGWTVQHIKDAAESISFGLGYHAATLRLPAQPTPARPKRRGRPAKES